MHDPGGWLGASWPFVRSHLPPAPAAVLEVGCGSAGGFVPMLAAEGYAAVGVDPVAPAEPGFHQVEFEHYEPPQPVAAVIASNSLHHVGDLPAAVGRARDALAPGGVLVVLEWGWERFDAATARWCFDRMPPDGAEWLRHGHDRWVASGLPWDDYFTAWASDHGLHPSAAVVDELDARFTRSLFAEGPFFFSDLGIDPEEERDAIAAGGIRATGIRYVGEPRPD